jgi:serine/threonine protein phosphatase PrpC
MKIIYFSACPEVETFSLQPDAEFIILACDGIWDVLSSQEVVSFCRERLAADISPETVNLYVTIFMSKLLSKCEKFALTFALFKKFCIIQ